MERLDRAVGHAVFGRDPDGYHAARSAYPDAFYEALDRRCGSIAGKRVFEVGPGTGIASQELLARGVGGLTAFEPDPTLAARLVDRLDSPRLRVCAVPFESNREAKTDFDLGVAATAFHWLDRDHAYREIRRLLRPGGQWAMWWNVYRSQSRLHPFSLALDPLIRSMPQAPQEGARGHYALDFEARLVELEDAGFDAPSHLVLRRDRIWTAREIRDLYASFSFVRCLEDDAKRRFLDRVEDMAIREFDGAVPNPVLTVGYFAAKPD